MPTAEVIKIMVSACLVGERVRYDGKTAHCSSTVLAHWLQAGRLVVCCPEMAGGLPVPRPPAEIAGSGAGKSVIAGYARVINRQRQDVTDCFTKGAQKVLEMAISRKVRLAVMKDGSPSCGSSYVYDGSFSNVRKAGRGVTAALLEDNDIRVFSEQEILKAAAYLNQFA